ncbi:hypothetical protein JGS22_008370 [Streptomyces sp. P38-E01]|uniref:Uncharacterized protein n=1 Tax=Streptomyces tardus TaxID=2780544 RepID=A0A949JCQ8_9ACTN|nr:hypothetical protein [Streptomyces tardus]MBU7597632.1 hypothetical protein [Streptomyces tardus]
MTNSRSAGRIELRPAELPGSLGFFVTALERPTSTRSGQAADGAPDLTDRQADQCDGWRR